MSKNMKLLYLFIGCLAINYESYASAVFLIGYVFIFGGRGKQ